jgi:hypothetical protein
VPSESPSKQEEWQLLHQSRSFADVVPQQDPSSPAPPSPTSAPRCPKVSDFLAVVSFWAHLPPFCVGCLASRLHPRPTSSKSWPKSCLKRSCAKSDRKSFCPCSFVTLLSLHPSANQKHMAREMILQSSAASPHQVLRNKNCRRIVRLEKDHEVQTLRIHVCLGLGALSL